MTPLLTEAAAYEQIYRTVEDFCEQVYHGLLFDEVGHCIPDDHRLSRYAGKFRSYLATQNEALAALEARNGQTAWQTRLFAGIRQHLQGLLQDIDLLNGQSGSCMREFRRSTHYNFFWRVLAHSSEVSTTIGEVAVSDFKGRLAIICQIASAALFCLCLLSSSTDSNA